MLLALFARTLAFHRDLIHYPYPLDSHEAAQEVLARGVAAGVSTGDLEQYPRYADLYGPVYPLLTGLLCRRGFGCSLSDQRLLCALFLGAVLALLAAACRRAGAGWLETGAISLWGYELLLINITPTAHPDCLGLLLWFGALTLPFLVGGAAWSLAVAAALVAVAALTKAYFATGALYLALGLALAGRWEALRIYAVWQAFAFGIAGVWLLALYPYDPTLVLLLSAGSNMTFSVEHLLLQLWVLGIRAAPLLLPLVAVSLRGDRLVDAGSGSEWGIYGALGLALFIGVFGGATGALFTYAVQLALLPVLPWFAATCRRLPSARGWWVSMLVLNALLTARMALHGGFSADSVSSKNWLAVTQAVAGARRPFVSSDLAAAVSGRGLPVFDTGLSDARRLPPSYPDGWKARLFPHIGDLYGREQAFLGEARSALVDPATDLVILNPDSPVYFKDLLDARFRKVGRIQVGYPQVVNVSWLECYVPLAAKKGPGPP